VQGLHGLEYRRGAVHGRGIIIPSYGTVLLAPSLGSEAAADTGKQGFKFGREDEGIIQSSFLKLQYCNPTFGVPAEG
jgi:hypothetical protein